MQNDRRAENHTHTYQTILDSAAVLIQRCGYHGFSYADVSEMVGIRKASIHYYFPGKADLVRTVIVQYRTAVQLAFAQGEGKDALQQLEQVIDFYSEDIEGTPRMCLCALLGAEMPTLPEAVRAEIQAFYQDQERLLSQLLTAGCRDGLLRIAGPVEVIAQVIRAGLEGAMVSARVYNDQARFRTIAENLIRPYRVEP